MSELSLTLQLVEAARVLTEDRLVRREALILKQRVLSERDLDDNINLVNACDAVLPHTMPCLKRIDLNKLNVPLRQASACVALTALEPQSDTESLCFASEEVRCGSSFLITL